MLLRIVMLSWLLSLIGCAPQPNGALIERSIQALTPDESRRVAEIRDRTIADLRLQYDVNDDEIFLLQQLVDDGVFSQTADMMPLGIVWGDAICREAGTEWVTAEWDGTRMLAVNVPKTTVLLFPIAMLEKRRDRNEHVDFRLFLTNTREAIKTMRANPDYQR